MAKNAQTVFARIAWAALVIDLAAVSCAAAPPGEAGESIGPDASLSLRGTYAFADGAASHRSIQAATAAGSQESTTVTTSEEDEGWTLDGPYFLRSADPLEAGELELKFIYGFETSSDEGDEHEVEFVLEWGMIEDIEFILEVPVTLGEGKVEGNGDIAEFGFHTRFWRESGWVPAFAMRNLIRIPTGYESDGVDYIGRGLLTKTIVPDTMRLHFNPFLKSINGNLEEDTRRFQWGAVIGVDYRVSDDLVLIADYQNRSSEEEGVRNQHGLELGADWEFAPEQILAFQTEFGLDGDSHGTDFGFRISYIIELPAPRLDQ